MADNRLPRQAMQWKPLWRKKKERAKLTSKEGKVRGICRRGSE
jgi:hypothetical protein